MGQDITVEISGGSARELAELTTRLCEELSRSDGIEASLVTRPALQGERGFDVPLWGQLALTFLSGGAATALIKVLAAWIPKRNDQTIEFKDGRGREFKITGADLTPDRLESVLQTLNQFIARSPKA